MFVCMYEHTHWFLCGPGGSDFRLNKRPLSHTVRVKHLETVAMGWASMSTAPRRQTLAQRAARTSRPIHILQHWGSRKCREAPRGGVLAHLTVLLLSPTGVGLPGVYPGGVLPGTGEFGLLPPPSTPAQDSAQTHTQHHHSPGEPQRTCVLSQALSPRVLACAAFPWGTPPSPRLPHQQVTS